MGLIRFCDPHDQNLDGLIKALVTWIYENRFAIVASLLLAQMACQAMRGLARLLQRHDTEKIKPILDNLVTRHFIDQEPEHHVYRATLFKVRWFPFVGKWLGIIARSGDLYTDFRTVFSVNANVKAYNTGYAGECWRMSGKTIIIEDALPDQRLGPISDESQKAYQEKGWIESREYSRMSVKSVVFLATGIKVNGKLWGILVLDSTDQKSKLAKSADKDREQCRLSLESAAMALGLLAA